MIDYICTNRLREDDARKIFKSVGWDVPCSKSEFFDENQLQICAYKAKSLSVLSVVLCAALIQKEMLLTYPLYAFCRNINALA